MLILVLMLLFHFLRLLVCSIAKVEYCYKAQTFLFLFLAKVGYSYVQNVEHISVAVSMLLHCLHVSLLKFNIVSFKAQNHVCFHRRCYSLAAYDLWLVLLLRLTIAVVEGAEKFCCIVLLPPRCLRLLACVGLIPM